MPHRIVAGSVALAAAASLALISLLAPPAAGRPAAGGATPIGPAVARAGSPAGPSTPGTARAAAAPTAPGHSDVERAAELHALAFIADARVAAGLNALQVDPGLESIARSRATDMRDRAYFAHVAPDGHTVFDMLVAAGVAWSAGSEVIGWNDEPTADASAARVVGDWLASPSHRSDLLASDSDRIGLASAVDAASGRRTWAAVLIVAAVQAPPVATVRVASIGPRDATGQRLVTISWSAHAMAGPGSMPGLLDVTVQLRTASGPWRTIAADTTASSTRLRLPTGHAAVVRVRPRDRAGILGGWASVRIAP